MSALADLIYVRINTLVQHESQFFHRKLEAVGFDLPIALVRIKFASGTFEF